jgi:hypothetical protein
MARPSADVKTTTQVNDTLAIDILAVQGLYVVLYQGQPFSIRQRYWGARGEFPKYVATTFPHKKSAENLADKFNEHFMTTEFTVTKIL